MPLESSGRPRPHQAPIEGFLPIRVVEWEPKRWRRWRGHVTVQAGHLKLFRCPVYVVNDTLHVSLPARPLFSSDGKPALDPGTGRNMYEPLIQWATKAAAERFSDAVVSALLAEHPEVAP